MGGGHPTCLHHRRRLCQVPLRWLGITFWSTSHHHFRQRGPIHFRSLGGPVQPAQHPALAHNSIPPSIERIGRAFPQVAEGRPAVLGRRHRLAQPPPLGATGYQDHFPRGQRIFAGEGGVRLAAGSTWTVHQHRRVAVAVLPQGAANHDDRLPATAARHNAAPAPSALPEELLLARFELVRRDGAQPPLSSIYDVPYRVLERSTHLFLLEMGDRTDKVFTLRLKAAQTPADTEPAKPPSRGRPFAQVPPVLAPPPKQCRVR
jgi:hypothetical protein